MGSMSYCRFRNTSSDLIDCREHLFDEDLGEEEEEAKRDLIKTCRDIIDDVGEPDEEDK